MKKPEINPPGWGTPAPPVQPLQLSIPEVRALAAEVHELKALVAQVAQIVGAGEERPRLLVTSTVAKYLGLTRGQIQQLVFKREIPFRKIRGRIFFTREDIEEWLNRKKIKATA